MQRGSPTTSFVRATDFMAVLSLTKGAPVPVASAPSPPEPEPARPPPVQSLERGGSARAAGPASTTITRSASPGLVDVGSVVARIKASTAQLDSLGKQCQAAAQGDGDDGSRVHLLSTEAAEAAAKCCSWRDHLQVAAAHSLPRVTAPRPWAQDCSAIPATVPCRATPPHPHKALESEPQTVNNYWNFLG